MSELIRKIDILMNGVSMGRVSSVREIRDEVSQVVAYSEALVDRCIEDTKKIGRLESQLKGREWVSVEDRLPDNRSDVLAYWRPIDHKDRPFHREIIIASLSFCEDGKYSDKWWANGRYYESDFITHWMPLPEAPQ